MKDKQFKVLRERFLNLYDEDTARNYYYTLNSNQVDRFEEHYDKDISQFNDVQAVELLRSLKTSSLQAIKSKRSILSMYTDFAVLEGFVKKNFYEMIPVKKLESIVSKRIQEYKYLSKAQIWDIVGVSPREIYTYNRVVKNEQDAALIMAISEGVKGANLSELSNLRVDDVNWDNGEVKLTNKDGQIRKINVSKHTLEFFKRAIEEDVYISYSTGESNSTNPFIFEKKLIESPYVFKKTTLRSDERLKYNGFRDRFKEIMQEYGNNIINMSGLLWSGAFIMAKELKTGKKELEKSDYIKIANKYDINVKSNTAYSNFKRKIDKNV